MPFRTHPDQPNPRSPNCRTVLAIGLTVLMVLGVVGCGSGNPTKVPVAVGANDPVQEMRYRVLQGKYKEAWSLADAALDSAGDDPETLAMVAEVAHANEEPERSAELLAKACALESYVNEERVRQAMVAMIGVGRLHDGMGVLKAAIAKQPDQFETRRWLFDFYMGTEDRPKGVPLGKQLVRDRKFDLELLMALSNTETRTMDPTPLQKMVELNPADKRPLIGQAKTLFDRNEIDAAIEILREIVDGYPEFLPAQALLRFAYAATDRFDKLETLNETSPDGITDYPMYWLSLGDWARSRGDQAEAARAYWEATRRDPDMAEPWLKLNTAIEQLPNHGGLSKVSRDAIAQRASVLTRFYQQKYRFERSGKVSREIAAEIAKSLAELGRLWEAEAWTAVAMGLPEDDAIDLAAIRGSIVAKLGNETPWQITADAPEFAVDLSRLGGEQIASASDPASMKSDPTNVDDDGAAVVEYVLTDEAVSRGLSFFGRTADDLQEPGIQLHQTLGCGGGTIDYDLDGWSDLYLITAGGTPPNFDSPPNALMRNIDGNFRDATNQSKTGDRGFGQGVVVGDINEDGFPDLVALNYGRNRIFINNGDGSFTDGTDQWFAADVGNGWSTSGAIADIDGDQIADLVVVNYCEGLDPITRTCPTQGQKVDRSCSPMIFKGEADLFLRGSGDGRLIDQTTLWNANPSVLGRGLGIIVGDLDRQNGIDVYVANDMTNNHYWSIRTGEVTEAVESAMLRGVGCDDRSLAQGSMGIAAGDLDQDGDLDLYVTNFGDEYNSYYEQRDAGLWEDVTKRRELSTPTLPWVGFGSEAIDLDNDGNLELVVTNGHVDMFERDGKKSVYEQPMQVFRRLRGGLYQSVGDQMSGDYMTQPHVGRALWTIDANRDGKGDLVVSHQTEPVSLLMNQTAGTTNWVSLKLIGTTSSRDAVGATVRLSAGDQQWTKSQLSGDGYLCSNERRMHFGLPAGTQSWEAAVTWPDGKSETFGGTTTRSAWSLTQGESKAFLTQ
ncbi:MAG: RNA-binding protein [Pirellulaceae bacterium]|nr:RNA-binding protein [Pirellulaceae bacterium]